MSMGKIAEKQMLQRIKEEQKKHQLDLAARRAEIEKKKLLEGIAREQRKLQLETMNKRQLLIEYRAVGNGGSERSMTKEWLIDRILWKEFDMSAGYDLLRWGSTRKRVTQ